VAAVAFIEWRMDTIDAGLREIRLAGKARVAEGTMAFHFAKPQGFTFKAGQAIDVVLDDPGGGTFGHAFSLVSAPFEAELVVATRMRDTAYKRALGALEIGGGARVEGPFGSLTLHNDRPRAAVFIAGGIGITPFLSILRQAVHDRREQPLALLYSNRRPEDAAYLDELNRLAATHRHLRLLATMTESARSGVAWNGETRPIGEKLVRTAAAGLPRPIFYVAGPPGMVVAARKALSAEGVDDDDIRSEEFHGY
jgi:ferredoxin-NADP reductase